MVNFHRFYVLSWVFFVSNVDAECSNLLGQITPNEQFAVSADNVVTDKVNKLMWMRCSLGQQATDDTCIGNSSKQTWLDALNQAERLIFAGFSDWRIPNKNELNTLIELSCNMPAINSEIFPFTGSVSYWTSSPYEDTESHLWTINFANGNIFAIEANQKVAVRFVRDL